MAENFDFTALAVTGISERALAAYSAFVVNAELPDDVTTAELISVGLAERLGGDLVALSPHVAVSSWLSERVQQEIDVRDAAVRLDALRSQKASRDIPSFLTYIAGEAALAGAAENLISSAQRSVKELTRGPFFRPETLTVFGSQKAALARGVTYRVIYDAEAIGLPMASRLIGESVDLGEESRVCPTLPMRVMIVDDSTALIVLPCVVDEAHGEAVGVDGLLVRASPLVDILLRIFEQHWGEGTDLGVLMTASELEDEQLLGLLAQGLTDSTISRTLGMSVRTVQRRVATIAAQLGVSGRFQLGVEAQRRGLLNSGPVSSD